ncbi:MAG: hypothetical protein ACRYG8_55195 [Janthinobacterium lividum]
MSEAALVIPGYWMAETSGRLASAVHAHMLGDEMTEQQVTDLRAYCLQWMRGSWQGEMTKLNAQLQAATTQPLLSKWMEDAMEAGIDPL